MGLEDITAITKISPRHLVALEEERFRLLPGGILSKGIVRGYTEALGLDSEEWLDRFMNAVNRTGENAERDEDWTAFASNVGRARIQRHESIEIKLRWLGAVLLVAAVLGLGFLVMRYYGLRAGWWESMLPVNSFFGFFHHVAEFCGQLTKRIQDWINN